MVHNTVVDALCRFLKDCGMDAQLSDLAPEGGYAWLAHTTQYIERETPPTATSTGAESNI